MSKLYIFHFNFRLQHKLKALKFTYYATALEAYAHTDPVLLFNKVSGIQSIFSAPSNKFIIPPDTYDAAFNILMDALWNIPDCIKKDVKINFVKLFFKPSSYKSRLLQSK